ncbi:predicted protein [Histoplasma capsulatum G186AR]|uniref:Uncharacterized protein n=1 Tax=Ajellomyces capsulatus (strain G186AR / H82 / ATCC MYA-2454 / RMSCC 2432) TaxID=447093 RepID=C0NI67_AJECG|nr:uncharacterized protein HCBG_03039 [Histoplasma capsulatum G186AR]EEH09502.1 predicted protein [Histoplasma capsulatum G186AR]
MATGTSCSCSWPTRIAPTDVRPARLAVHSAFSSSPDPTDSKWLRCVHRISSAATLSGVNQASTTRSGGGMALGWHQPSPRHCQARINNASELMGSAVLHAGKLWNSSA